MFLEPSTLLPMCGIMPTDTVADFGAGSGFMAKAAAALVPNGNVFAIEIHRDIVLRLSREVSDMQIKNLHPLWGDIEIDGGSKLDTAAANFGMLSNVLFHIEDKEGCLKEVARVLKPEGKLLIVDWTESFGGMGPRPHEIVTKEAALALCARFGLTVINDALPAGEHHYAILLKKSSKM